jgi:tetratricopeptide (TPR) repeat protein
MLFNSPAIQNVKDIKSEHQLASVENRIAALTAKLEKASTAVTNHEAKPKQQFDWTQAYTNWSKFEDTEDLQQSKAREEAKLDSILNKGDNLGHYHDHSKERGFFDRPESEKFSACEDNRLMGNYLFKEGVFAKAAEHYQIAIAYYEYCFPDNPSEQANLDELRRACLCNISLCYVRLGYYRQAVESATIVLKETAGRHVKALFRRAQAFRALDEYRYDEYDRRAALLMSLCNCTDLTLHRQRLTATRLRT